MLPDKVDRLTIEEIQRMTITWLRRELAETRQKLDAELAEVERLKRLLSPPPESEVERLNGVVEWAVKP